MEDFEAEIKFLLEDIRKTTMIVEDFRVENQARLLEDIQKIVSRFDKISKLADESAKNILLPKELFAFLDSGTNPDLFTKQVLESSIRDSEICKGKIEALSEFADLLQKEAIAAYPELQEQYEVKQDAKEPETKKTKH